MRLLRIILVVLVVLLLISLVFAVVFGGKKSSNNKSTTTDTTTLSSAANTDATVSFLTDGAINSNEAHRQINITVSKTARTLTIYQGYQQQVLSTQSFSNNQQAYESFLNALDVAGFTKERTNATVTDIAGQCPLGLRYIYSSTAIPNVPNNLWAATCGAKLGNFGGTTGTINTLFQAQIPNYSSLVSNVKLN